MLAELVDSGDRVFDAPEAAAANRLSRDETEPPFGLFEPRRLGRGVMDMKARSLCHPNPKIGMLVGGIEVDNETDRKTACAVYGSVLQCLHSACGFLQKNLLA